MTIRAQTGDSFPADALSAVGKVGDVAKRLSRAASEFDAQIASEAARALEKIRAMLEELATQLPDLRTLMEDAQRRADDAFNQLDTDLREALAAQGWRCDGSWPTLYVERAIAVVIDPKSHTATVSARHVKSVSVERIVESLKPLVPTLIPAQFSAARFMADLVQAYDDTVRDSALVPIFDIYRAFVVRAQRPKFWRDTTGPGFVSISADQFRARLTAALESGVSIGADGRQLRLLPPLDSKEGLFMYEPAERRFAFMGRIEFVRPEE